MSAMDHRESDGWCIYCHHLWPCNVAKIRRELAEYIRGCPVGNTGDATYDNGREAGQESAADGIDITI